MDRVLIHWYWKMNWNWCFHSSAAGRVSSEEGNFDQLRTKLCLKYLNEKLDNKTARKREISGGWELKTPALLLFFLYDVVIIATRARVSISVNPSPIWCSVRLPLDPQDLTGYGPSTYVLNRASEEREMRLRDLKSQRDEYIFTLHHPSSLAAHPTIQCL